MPNLKKIDCEYCKSANNCTDAMNDSCQGVCDNCGNPIFEGAFDHYDADGFRVFRCFGCDKNVIDQDEDNRCTDGPEPDKKGE